MKRDLAASLVTDTFQRILGDVNCIYVMQRKIYNICMNDDMQRKIITYVHMNVYCCIVNCWIMYHKLAQPTAKSSLKT